MGLHVFLITIITLLYWLFISHVNSINTNAYAHIGCLFQNKHKEKQYLEDVAKLALSQKIEILAEHGLFHNNFTFTCKDSGCNSTQGLRMGAELLLRSNVSVIIGPNCNEACVPIANLANFSKTPIISYGCTSNNVDAVVSSYIRMVPNVLHNLERLAQLYSDFILSEDWSSLSIVYADHEPWSSFKRHIKVKLKTKNKVVDDYNLERYTVEKLMNTLEQKGKRVILFACETKDVANVFKFATKGGNNMLYNNQYAFLTINFDTSNEDLETFNKNLQDGKKFGFLNIALKTINASLRYIEDSLSRDKANVIKSNIDSSYVYDSIHGYLLALNRSIYSSFETYLERSMKISQQKLRRLLVERKNLTLQKLLQLKKNDSCDHIFQISGSNISDSSTRDLLQACREYHLPPVNSLGKHLVKELIELKYQGLTGYIQFSKDGDRAPIIIIYNVVVNKSGKKSEPWIEIEYSERNNKQTKDENLTIIWPDGTNKKPNPHYIIRDDLVNTVLMGLFIPVCSVLFVAVGYRIYRNQQYEGDLMNKDIIFKFKEVEIPQLKIPLETDFEGQEKPPLSPDMTELPGVISNQPSSRRKRKKQGIIDILEGIGAVNSATGVRTFFAKFQGDGVFVKQIPKSQVLVTREILVELKDIRDLRHPNLNPYEGVCVGPPYVLLLSPICKKGTLLDILQTEDIQLNWVFRYTFATDIANGLQALHDSPLKYHGHLTSRNVLVDSRWNCKITDYGLNKFKQVLPLKQPSNDPVIEGKIYEALLWTAPENIQYPIPKKSKEGDIYSFGIILAEIINRSQGFSSFKNYTSRDIVHFIQKRCIPPFRPHVRLQSGLDGRALDLMRSCWDEFPENRPTIGELRARLKTIHNTKTNSKNLLDDMIDMMEKYAHDLEVALNERTMQLTTEKERSEEANFLSLPENVADHLKNGGSLAPQLTNNATVMLIKIDDITQFCRRLSPQQVIDLLDDVHRIIEKSCDPQVTQFMYHKDRHGIGCGLLAPIRFHASRIGKIALKIMGSLTSFAFRHIKQEELKLTIALHSGEFVVAIQDGRVPTFVVLGRNLTYLENILESTPTLRIFITGEALKFIKLDVGPSIESSGTIMVKGFGQIQGHFLLGIKGINVVLPRTDAAALLKPSLNKGTALN